MPKDAMNYLFDMVHTTMVDTGTSVQLSQKMIAACDCDLFFERVNLSLMREKYTIQDVAFKIKAMLKNSRAVMPFDEHSVVISGTYTWDGEDDLDDYDEHDEKTINAARKSTEGMPKRHHLVIDGQLDNEPVLIWVAIGRETTILELKIDIIAGAKTVLFLKDSISKAFQEDQLAMIKWWYQTAHGEGTRNVYLPPGSNTYKIHPEFYPDLGNPDKYLEDYMNSDEAILLLGGPPGTGKTTLIRHLIMKYKLCAHVIYDERIMEKDGVFQSFLFEEKGDIMVIEDADTILSTRERDDNKLMSRFLNVSDGLIKLPNKKLIFTTNIRDFNNVDEALLRPGRCFGVMHTRELDLTEAVAVAKVANLPVPTEKRLYTLAELFNSGKKQMIRNIGFGVRH